jgi:hypothetical protein
MLQTPVGERAGVIVDHENNCRNTNGAKGAAQKQKSPLCGLQIADKPRLF